MKVAWPTSVVVHTCIYTYAERETERERVSVEEYYTLFFLQIFKGNGTGQELAQSLGLYREHTVPSP